MEERALARPGNAGQAGEDAEREPDVEMAEVVLVGVADEKESPRLAAALGDGDLLLPAQVAGRERAGARGERLPRPFEEDLPAVLPGPRAEVDDVLGGADDLGVVLDDHDRVADLPERAEDLDEPGVVARMKPDRGLVEDEERPDERRAQGGGEVDALGLPAAQGEGHPVERDVVEPDLEEELQPVLDLGDELVGHLLLRFAELGEEAAKKRVGVLDREADDLADGQPSDLDAQGPGVEAGLAALGAGLVLAVAAEEDADLDLVFLGLQPVEEALDPHPAVAAVEDEALVVAA